MGRLMVLVFVVMSGCAAAKAWMPAIATTAAMGATACDWHQTHETAIGPRRMDPNWEANPIMGGDPSASTVDSYFATVGSAEMVAGASLSALHGKARWIGVAAMFALAAYELELSRENVNAGTPRCF